MVDGDGVMRADLATALLSLLRFRLSRREQTVLRAIVLAPTPPSAWTVAKRTRLAYSHVKDVRPTSAARRIGRIWRLTARTRAVFAGSA